MRARVPFNDIAATLGDVQEALAVMYGKHERPGFVGSAVDDRVLWTFDDDAVTFFWREGSLPEESAPE